MSERNGGYDAARIQVLKGLEAIRKRPGMYVGSTGERGLHELVFNVADRPVNEVLAGRVGFIDVTLTPDGGVRIADNGSGNPLESEGPGCPGLEAQLTRTHPGTEPGGRHGVALDLYGMGLGVTNALSSRLTAEVQVEGTRWIQEYARGVAVTQLTAVGPATGSGTTIAFLADPDVFGTAEFSFETLAKRFRELAFLNRELDITLTDERPPGQSRSERFRSPGGARDFVDFLNAQGGAPVHTDTIGFEREDPGMAGTLEVALQWCGSHEKQVLSFANSRPTPGGGTHMVGFRDGLTTAVNAYARKQRLLMAADPDLSADRISEGLTAVVSVKLDHPEFLGSTHGVLGNATMRPCVAQTVQEQLSNWLETDPEQAAAFLGRIVAGTRRG